MLPDSNWGGATLLKTRTVVKPQRRIIVLVDFQKYGPRAKPGQPAQNAD